MIQPQITTAAPADGRRLVEMRHPEWAEELIRWRWLLDSYEGGNRYRQATYGKDRLGLDVRNLIRHKRETPDRRDNPTIYAVTPFPSGAYDALSAALPARAGSDPYSFAGEDEYELRRARTPVPTFMKEAIDGHLSHIYDREIVRKGPAFLEDWWLDVDGMGTPIDRFMEETVAPLLLTLGCLDLIFENPPAPGTEPIRTQADVRRLKLDRCIVGTILPERMVWWEQDLRTRRYLQCLVRECDDLGVVDPKGSPIRSPNVFYRHWTPTYWTLYNADGNVLDEQAHGFGVVPIVRVFDQRNWARYNLPNPRYAPVADWSRDYYNRDSELILSDTLQAFPLLEGPEDYVQADGTVPVGPSWLLPKKKNVQGGSATYEGFRYVDPPKGSADSIRANLDRIEEKIDRYTNRIKPAGARSSAKNTLEQSGISKAIDHQAAHKQLAQISSALERCERDMAEFAALVLTKSESRAHAIARDIQAVPIVYPQDFELYSVSDVAVATSDFQAIALKTGVGVPDAEKAMLKRLLRLCQPGLDDPAYKKLDAEIDAFIAKGGGMAMLAQAQADMQMQAAEASAMKSLSPAGNVRNDAQAPPALNKPGDGGGNTSGS